VIMGGPSTKHSDFGRNLVPDLDAGFLSDRDHRAYRPYNGCRPMLLIEFVSFARWQHHFRWRFKISDRSWFSYMSEYCTKNLFSRENCYIPVSYPITGTS